MSLLSPSCELRLCWEEGDREVRKFLAPLCSRQILSCVLGPFVPRMS